MAVVDTKKLGSWKMNKREEVYLEVYEQCEKLVRQVIAKRFSQSPWLTRFHEDIEQHCLYALHCYLLKSYDPDKVVEDIDGLIKYMAGLWFNAGAHYASRPLVSPRTNASLYRARDNGWKPPEVSTEEGALDHVHEEREEALRAFREDIEALLHGLQYRSLIWDFIVDYSPNLTGSRIPRSWQKFAYERGVDREGFKLDLQEVCARARNFHKVR